MGIALTFQTIKTSASPFGQCWQYSHIIAIVNQQTSITDCWKRWNTTVRLELTIASLARFKGTCGHSPHIVKKESKRISFQPKHLTSQPQPTKIPSPLHHTKKNTSKIKHSWCHKGIGNIGCLEVSGRRYTRPTSVWRSRSGLGWKRLRQVPFMSNVPCRCWGQPIYIWCIYIYIIHTFFVGFNRFKKRCWFGKWCRCWFGKWHDVFFRVKVLLGACFSIKAFVSIDFPATASVCPGNRSLLSCSQVLRSLPRAPKSLPHGRALKSLPRCRVLKSLLRCRVLKNQLVQLEKLHC